MTDTLTARLLAEIERREGPTREQLARMGTKWGHGVVSRELAYLAALRKVVELHADNGIGCCRTCGDEAWGDDYPCKTLRCVDEGLGMEVE